MRTKLRNVRTGSVLERTFNAGIRVEQAIVDRQDMQFLYRDGDDYVFMNTSTYDQLTVPRAALGNAADYLVEQAVAQIAQYQGQIIGVEIPASVELTIVQTEPGVQGDRVSGARKPAELETGKTVQVPLFVEIGDRIKVDTRSGDYITARSESRRAPPGAPASARRDRRRPRRTPGSGRCTCCTRRRPRASRPVDALEVQIVEPDAMTATLVRGVDRAS